MAREMNEAQRVGLVRNALLVAGYEMGENGEHWPVINDCIHQIARDWEEYKLLKDADAEMKIHVYQQLELMEKDIAEEKDPEIVAEMTTKLHELRELFDAYYCSTDADAVIQLNDDEIPEHIKRTGAIIATLGGSDA